MGSAFPSCIQAPPPSDTNKYKYSINCRHVKITILCDLSRSGLRLSTFDCAGEDIGDVRQETPEEDKSGEKNRARTRTGVEKLIIERVNKEDKDRGIYGRARELGSEGMLRR